MGKRIYHLPTARFLQPDPLGHASDMSLYSYANGDPVNFVDPTGRHPSGLTSGITGFTGLMTPGLSGGSHTPPSSLNTMMQPVSMNFVGNPFVPHQNQNYNAMVNPGYNSSSDSASQGRSVLQIKDAIITVGPRAAWDAQPIVNIPFTTNTTGTWAKEFGSQMGREVAKIDRARSLPTSEAARHIAWIAGLTVNHGVDKARNIGNLHERGQENTPDSLRDQFNNQIGLRIGSQVNQVIHHPVSISYQGQSIILGGPMSTEDTRRLIEQMAREAIRNGEAATGQNDLRIYEGR